jgi:cyanate lyase
MVARERGVRMCDASPQLSVAWAFDANRRHMLMEKIEMSELLLEAKKNKGMTWAELSKAVGMSEVWLASVFYGESSANEEAANKIVNALDLGEDVQQALLDCPIKGNSMGSRTVPTDPFLYRFYEILAVYGLPMKDVIQEKFGDGIMSAVDFTMDIQKQEDPKGDRVIVTMNGKFLPYRRW